MSLPEPEIEDQPAREVDEDRAFNHLVAAVGVVAGTIGALLAVVALPEAVSLWVRSGIAVFVFLYAVAFAGLLDPVTRATLRTALDSKGGYTGLYNRLTGALLHQVWSWLHPGAFPPGWPDPKEPGRLREIWGYALSHRMFDGAFMLAFTYPVLLPMILWVATGVDNGIYLGEAGHSFPAAPFFPDRLVTLTSLVPLTLAGIFGFFPQTLPTRFLRIHAREFAFLFLILVFFLAASGSTALSVRFPDRLSYVYLFEDPVTFAVAGGVAGAVVFGGVTAATTAYMGESAGLSFSAIAVAVAIAIAISSMGVFVGALLFVFLFVWLSGLLEYWGWHGAARLILLGWIATCVVTLLTLGRLGYVEMSPGAAVWFTFLALLPLLNALFDIVSYTNTLTLMTWGYGRGWKAAAMGVLDLAIAVALFLTLGAAIVAMLGLMAWGFGEPVFDLGTLLTRLHNDPGSEAWVILMACSTLLPTGIHAALGLLSLQAIPPNPWRQGVARAIGHIGIHPLAAFTAPLGLAALWTLSVGVAALICYGLYELANFVFDTELLTAYINGLLWLGYKTGAIQ